MFGDALKVGGAWYLMIDGSNVQCGWYGWSCLGLCLRGLELGRLVAITFCIGCTVQFGLQA